ncbi:MAG: phage baseplate assembly protein V [Lysobacter sp.]|nr:phage baseplate assembly protein V [Lysobacter sp.]
MAGVMFEMGSIGVDAPEPDDRRITGVFPALVVSNTDSYGEGRVQLQIPWLPGFLPWARVSVPMAGMARGMYFIPQMGDEVLVAFCQGDVREPYVIGSLWSTLDRPHELLPDAPITKRSIRTPTGHEISFDEKGTLGISSSSFDSVTLSPTGIDISTIGGTVSISLSKTGDLTISALKSITLDAPSISIGGMKTVDVSVKSKASLSLNGGASCSVKAARIDLN